MDESILRRDLIELLRGGQARAVPEKILAVINADIRHITPAEGLHSVWEELEHMRIAQQDILRYMIDPSWKSPDFPDGLWPAPADEVSDEMWSKSVEAFFSELKELVDLINDASINLTDQIPHGQEGHTYLRGVLLVADHNSYHLGQIVQVRKLLGDWLD